MPDTPYLVYGTVTSSLGYPSKYATVNLTSSLGTMSCTADANGNYVKDLADIGYSSGETISVSSQDRFNNESLSTSFVVSGAFYLLNISLTVRASAQGSTGYTVRSMLHTVGNSPVTQDNPLPVENVHHPFENYALSGGDDSNRIYGYVNKLGAWYIQKYDSSAKTYKYARGSSDFSNNWTNRSSLTYGFFNEVFV